MIKKLLLVPHEEDVDGILVAYNADAVFMPELQNEIVYLVNSPKVRTLNDAEVEKLLKEYRTRMKQCQVDNPAMKDYGMIQSLLCAAKAYWDEQGIKNGSTESLLDEINRLHPDWKVRVEEKCLVFSVWT